MGVFALMTEGLSAQRAAPQTIMIDATYLKAHRTASRLGAKKGHLGRLIGRTKGGMNTKLHAVTDTNAATASRSCSVASRGRGRTIPWAGHRAG